MIEKTSYVIYGYDLTDSIDRKMYNEWQWTEEGVSFRSFLREIGLWLFDDPMNNEYMALGRILWEGDYYDGCDFKAIDMTDDWIDSIRKYNKTHSALLRLEEIGLVPIGTHVNKPQKLMCFTEWS